MNLFSNNPLVMGIIAKALVLGILAVIRTFLTWTLMFETEGCLP